MINLSFADNVSLITERVYDLQQLLDRDHDISSLKMNFGTIVLMLTNTEWTSS